MLAGAANCLWQERSLGTADRKIAERRLKEWGNNLEKVDAEVEKTTLHQSTRRYQNPQWAYGKMKLYAS